MEKVKSWRTSYVCLVLHFTSPQMIPKTGGERGTDAEDWFDASEMCSRRVVYMFAPMTVAQSFDFFVKIKYGKITGNVSFTFRVWLKRNPSAHTNTPTDGQWWLLGKRNYSQ